MTLPNELSQVLQKAQAALDQQAFGDAVRHFERALQLAPEEAPVVHHLGATMVRGGQVEAGLQLLQVVARVQPADAHLHNHIGHAQMLLRQYEPALAAYRAALELEPAHVSARTSVAQLLLRAGAAEAALRHIDVLQAAAPDSEPLAELRAKVLAERHRAQPSEAHRLAAVAAWQRALDLGGEVDYIRYLMAALGEGAVPEAMPHQVVADMFDGYADEFDSHLLGPLEYRTPPMVMAVVEKLGPLADADVLDLGCGTGLCGILLKPLARRLVGVDLSPGMLDKARERALYDELICADIGSVMQQRPASFDLVVAGDVFVYIGDLNAVMRDAHTALRPGGRFVFSIETVDSGEYLLRSTRRYAHCTTYVERLAAQHGLQVRVMATGSLRSERNEPVPGAVLGLLKPEPAALVEPAADPNPLDALLEQAHAAMALRAYDRAVALLRQVLELAPDAAVMVQGLGTALAQGGDCANGLCLLELVIPHRPQDPGLWNNLGNTLGRLERHDDAAAAYRRALALRPGHPKALLSLAHVLFAGSHYADALAALEPVLQARPDERKLAELAANILTEWHVTTPTLERRTRAAQAWRRVIELGGDAQELRFLIAALGDEPTPVTAPPQYVAALFDAHADEFDQHLLGKLNYRTPKHIAALIPQLDLPEPHDTLDLGCGTGLCGIELKPPAGRLVGVDLSAGMLAKAEQRHVYDELICAELTTVMAQREQAFDLVVASDVLTYMGDLSAVFAAARHTLRAGGYFVFSVEAQSGEHYSLLPTRRYAHSARYLMALAEAQGLELQHLSRAPMRTERGVPVIGYLLACIKPDAAAGAGA